MALRRQPGVHREAGPRGTRSDAEVRGQADDEEIRQTVAYVLALSSGRRPRRGARRDDARRLPLFPLPGVVLLPGTLLPAPHLRAALPGRWSPDALAGDRTIGMAMLKPGGQAQADTAADPRGRRGAGEIVESEDLAGRPVQHRARRRAFGTACWRNPPPAPTAGARRGGPPGSASGGGRIGTAPSRRPPRRSPISPRELELPPLPAEAFSRPSGSPRRSRCACATRRRSCRLSWKRTPWPPARGVDRPDARVAEPDPVSRAVPAAGAGCGTQLAQSRGAVGAALAAARLRRNRNGRCRLQRRKPDGGKPRLYGIPRPN